MVLKFYLSILLFMNRDVFSYKLNDSEHARMPPLFHLDDYGRCLSEEDGLYCVVKITLTANPENDLMRMIKKYSQDTLIHYNYTYLEHGVCASKRCKSFISKIDKENTEDLRLALEGCLSEPFRNEYGLDANVTVNYCNRPNESENIDSGDRIFGVCVFILMMLNIIATLYDLRLSRKLDKNTDKGNQLLLSFSIIQNWKQLIASDTGDPRFAMFQGIHGLRSILTFLMVIAHSHWLMGCGFMDNTHDFEKTYENPMYIFIYNGMMLVQTYFLISGCLLVFTMSVNAETKKHSFADLPLILFVRWCRLAASLALMLGFITTWYRHLGSGPLWKLHAMSTVNDCRQYWWTHLLFVNNFSEEDKGCLIQTWHIAVEFQVFVIGLMIYLVARTRVRNLLIFLMFLVGCVAPVLHVWLQDNDGVLLLIPEVYRTFETDGFWKMHIKSHNNLACYAIGMQLGYFIYSSQTKKFNFSKYKILGYITWVIVPTIFLIYLSGGVFYAEGERPPAAVMMAYAASHRAVLGACIAYIVLSLVFKFEDYVRGMLEWKGWRVPSRLGYGVYLIHVNIINYIQGTQHQLGHAAYFNVFIHHLGIVWLSFILAVPLHLLVEVPINTCVKRLLFNKPSKIEANGKNK